MTSESPSGLGDLHSHLVPAVDDGAQSLEDALEGIGRMKEAGIVRIVTTPHLEGSLTREPDAYSSFLGRMDEAWEKVSAAAADEFPDVEFHRGQEVMLDIPDVDFSEERIRLAGTSFVLVEWPRLQVPPETPRVVSRIRFGGLKPIIAHPERYRGVGRELQIMGEWRRMGAYLQVSYGSFVGRYGDRAKKRAFQLLERGWIDYLSTDFHGRPNLELYLDEAREILEEAGADEQFSLLAETNPARLLRDEEPISVPGIERESGIWKRLRRLFGLN
ncbi:MAG: CpsB/CapC family capsule biosynthesis tyrosine phosphatase [Longimicrobiales bacterium]|nr:CpsB/CapC family capsule biosynthesis tyrosine phosphatase [Longimicrobiales bacterium]